VSAQAIRVGAHPDGSAPRPSPSRRAILRRIPRAAWVCALVAILNAVCWSIITPAFQAPDEPDHVAYVKQLAETGELPSSSSEQLSREELAVEFGVRHFYVLEQPQNHTISTQGQLSELDRYLTVASSQTEKGSPAAGVAASQPPLYYALESIPYTLASASSLLVRVQLMRLLSALFGGLTALFAFLFAREALPAARWSWTVAGLTVALVPLFGFMSGSVNPDALLYAASAAAFYCLARAFQRGLDTRGAVALGAVTAVGFLTKLNFLGLAPGLALGMALLSLRAYWVHGRTALRLPAICGGIGFSPPALYGLVNAVSNRPLFGLASRSAETVHGSIFAELNYIWQLYLPRLPGTVNDFPGLLTTKQLWFHGYVGLYGWFDTTFPSWVYSAALVPATAIALLCARELVRGRAALRGRVGELSVYATIALSMVGLIGADGYHSFPYFTGIYAQVRYLLPLLPLFGAALALAARGAGRRYGPLAGTLIVMLFLAHDLFSQMLTIGRYYG
jgi:4-amino-4-deoxy-L-arabinose transferase-like glycosyltransferase